MDATPCRWCGLTHGPLCPSVKSLDFHRNGSVARVVFVTAADFPPSLLSAKARDMLIGSVSHAN